MKDKDQDMPGQSVFSKLVDNIAGHYNATTATDEPLIILLIQDPMLQSIIYTVIIDFAFLGLIYILVFYCFKYCFKDRHTHHEVGYDQVRGYLI